MAGRGRSGVIEVLEGVPLFSSLTKRQLRAVAAECSEVHFEPGDVLVKELDWGQHMVAITAGKASVVRAGKKIAKVGEGEVIGEMSLIDGEPRSASVVADTAVDGLMVYGTAFRKLLSEHPTMATKLLLAQTARLRALDKRAGLYG
jgi:CRP/FNR family transcriptional regulator, cyclic AMP receptor protein